MKEKLKNWWKRSTLNEKLMYALIIVMIIGIATRWEIIATQVTESFGGLFAR